MIICPFYAAKRSHPCVVQVTEEKSEAAEADWLEPALGEVKSEFARLFPLNQPPFPVFSCPCPTQTQFKT